MNKRIKELSNKAVVTASATYAKGPDAIWLKEYNEKFAELIVRECIKVIETNHPEVDCKESADNLIRRAGRMDAIDEINNYFEVEQ